MATTTMKYAETGVEAAAYPKCDVGVSKERVGFLDMSFTRFYSVDLVKILYAIGLVALFLGSVGVLFYGIRTGRLIVTIPYVLIGVPVAWMAMRVALEALAAVFKIAGLLQELVEKGKQKG